MSITKTAAFENALCHPKDSTQVDPAAQFRERLRIQELLRYFEPYDGPGPGEGKARVATDTALTALAQLCAHRLNCQRSFISIITDAEQYLAAEATRTVSLKDEDVHEVDDDAIFLGQCTINFEWGVCPGTIACFTSPDGSLDVNSRYIKATRSYYVMNDMSALEDFKDRPYIAGWPYMKYYAEVPIHSPSGLTIGTLCVVDNKPKDGLDLKGLSILREISEVIMNHLELCVNRIHRNNTEKMIQALGKFVEGKDSVRDWWIEAQSSRIAEPSLQHLSVEKRADIELGSRTKLTPSIDSVVGMSETHQAQVLDKIKSQSGSIGYFDNAPSVSSRTETSSQSSHFLSDGSSEVPRSPGTDITSPDSTPTASLVATPSAEMQSSSLVNDDTSQELSDLDKMLNRATNLIREGIGLDGIVLFDPRSSDGQLLTDLNISGEKVAWSDRRSSSISPTAKPATFGDSSSYFPPFDQQTPPSSKYCKILASSTRTKSNAAYHAEGLLVPENILQMLLQRYPRGGILNYDKKGFIGGDDTVFLHIPESQKNRRKSKLKPRNSVKDHSSVEADQLRTIIPEATSVLLLPLWDTNQDKWFAYSLAWTTNPAHILQRPDFTYLTSFGNSIMTELSRLETVAADNAKSGFISSISHELRSPLHGIMASVELLRDANRDPVSNAIINTVDSCGSTLLDTIENLLTFTKVNRLTVRANSLVARCAPAVDLAAIVEDVTQMLSAGHYFRRTVESSGIPRHKDVPRPVERKASPGLAVICDVSPTCDWVFKTDASIWKRILMNLLGNALKYTSSGFILVKLRLEEDLPVLESKTRPTVLATRAKSMINPDLQFVLSPVAERMPFGRQSTTLPRNTKTFNVTLAIEDSGKGMSQDYLTHHLFKPFYQEDILSPGTGLGLSIVHQLVSSIGGSAHVTSELGSGTEVRIDVALQRPDATTAPLSLSSPSQFKGLRLGLYGLDAVPDLSETPSGILDAIARRSIALCSTLADYAMNLEMSILTVDSLDSDTADLILTPEAEYQRISSSKQSSFHKPLIVLSAEPMIRYGKINAEFGSAVVLSQPFGPSRFKQAVESCLTTPQEPRTLNQVTAIIPKTEIPVAIDTSKDIPLLTIPKPEFISIPAKQKELLPSGQKQLSLLLVEDNPINLKLLIASFKKMGHCYSTATDGSLAVEAYRNADSTRNPKFDVIFMDIQMLVMDGMKATTEIRKYEKQHELQPAIIIALTALTTLQAEQEAFDAGADRFMNKPVSIKKLRDVVGEYFREEQEGG
ncbi:hypothetical protein N431DRAFT_407507 [Stipitochalara longipes BDJ]|nr:hypothetical protein N431DRAFT_407507 [Stipitochalara longipes BDJ]